MTELKSHIHPEVAFLLRTPAIFHETRTLGGAQSAMLKQRYQGSQESTTTEHLPLKVRETTRMHYYELLFVNHVVYVDLQCFADLCRLHRPFTYIYMYSIQNPYSLCLICDLLHEMPCATCTNPESKFPVSKELTQKYSCHPRCAYMTSIRLPAA